jgi:hypothetical protein
MAQTDRMNQFPFPLDQRDGAGQLSRLDIGFGDEVGELLEPLRGEAERFGVLHGLFGGKEKRFVEGKVGLAVCLE